MVGGTPAILSSPFTIYCVKVSFTLILILPQTVAQIGMEVDSHYKISFNFLMKSILQSTVGRVVELSFQTER